MYYKIYPDVIFIANLLIDYTILSVSCRLCKITTTYAKLAVSAIVGAVWSVIMAFVRGGNIPALFCTYLCVPAVMLYIAGCRGHVREWIYRYAAFMSVSVIMGGIMGLLREKSADTFAAFAAVVLFAQAACPLLRYLSGYVKRRNLLYSVRIELDGRSVDVMGLYDTGNSLADPYNGKPVCIVENKAVKDLLQTGGTGSGVRLIPYRSIGKSHGLMKLVTVDSMIIEYEGRQLRCRHPELALYEGRLSGAGDYSMILNTASLDKNK